jgi:hypothetical protein
MFLPKKHIILVESPVSLLNLIRPFDVPLGISGHEIIMMIQCNNFTSARTDIILTLLCDSDIGHYFSENHGNFPNLKKSEYFRSLKHRIFVDIIMT